MNDDARLLRWTLQANGCISLASGACMLAFARPLGALLGVPEPLWLWILGPGLLAFGALVLGLGRQRVVSAGKVRVVIWLDWAWVAGSAAILVFFGGYLSTLGLWLVADVALVVATFAVLQQFGLRQVLEGKPGEKQSLSAPGSN